MSHSGDSGSEHSGCSDNSDAEYDRKENREKLKADIQKLLIAKNFMEKAGILEGDTLNKLNEKIE